MIKKFSSPYGTVVLTDERKKHILDFHPDVRGCLGYFAKTLAEPEYIISSKHDPSVLICYSFLKPQKKCLAIVIKTGAHPFLLTAYLVKKPKSATI